MAEPAPGVERRAGSRAPSASSRAASTPRCAPSRRSAAPPTRSSRGEGAYVTDVEGTRYIDLVQSYGAVLLGHAHPVVTEAVAARGGARAPPSARRRRARCCWPRRSATRVPGCEQVRLVSSGTEAAMSAVRLARGATGPRPGRQVRRLLPRALRRAARRRRQRRGHARPARARPACRPARWPTPRSCRTTSCPSSTSGWPASSSSRSRPTWTWSRPAPGFLEGLRAACDAAGALLIFDEVITGFRLGPGGATAWAGVTPDLWCFGKVIGGGLPVGAFGGPPRADGRARPGGPVYQAGTLSGNPLATAAGLAVLGHVEPSDYEDARSAGGGASPRTSRRRSPPAALRRRARRSGRWWGSSSAPARPGTDGAADRLRVGVGLWPATALYPPLLPRHAAARGGARPGALRGDVPGPRPRRRGAGPGGGGRGEAAAEVAAEVVAGPAERSGHAGSAAPTARLSPVADARTWPATSKPCGAARGAPCAHRRTTDGAIRHARVRGPVGRRVPRAPSGAAGLRVRHVEGPARGGADGAVARGGGGVLGRGGARARARSKSGPGRPR